VTRARGPEIQLEVGAIADTPLRPQASPPLSAGARLRLFVGNRWVGGVIGVAGVSPTTLTVTGDRARLTRVPIDLAVRGRVNAGRFAASLDIGAVAAVQITQGLDVSPPLRETRLELGVLLGAAAQYRAWARVAPFVSLQAELVPSPYHLTLPALGTVGTTPAYWLAAEIGVSIALR
jgi:hypothetical protein